MKLTPTPSQTVGPFFSIGMARDDWSNLVSDKTAGQRIAIEGRVLDGDGAPVPDAVIEIWQANAAGRYNHPEDTQEKVLDPAFLGFGRCATDSAGRFRFRTIKPGPVYGRGARAQAPHINVSVFARGLLKRLVTRIYFPDEPLNATDPVFNAISEARRATLVACAARAGAEPGYQFDVVLQGAGETVFLDV
jgi:protocatechuate 3,4-dioxygenase, alpha subunit